MFMNLLRITNGFDKLPDSELEVRSANIIASITGNTYFPTPTPSLTEVQAALDTFSAALAIARTGSSLEKAIKNQKKQALVTTLHSLGNYVLFTANGDVLVAKSSGFSVAKSPTPLPELTKATNQKLEDGQNPGELRYSFDRVHGSRSYIYQYTPDPITENSVWQTQTGTVRKVTFTGLRIGERYWCRAVAIGPNGQGVYSDPISRIVQ